MRHPRTAQVTRALLPWPRGMVLGLLASWALLGASPAEGATIRAGWAEIETPARYEVAVRYARPRQGACVIFAPGGASGAFNPFSTRVVGLAGEIRETGRATVFCTGERMTLSTNGRVRRVGAPPGRFLARSNVRLSVLAGKRLLAWSEVLPQSPLAPQVSLVAVGSGVWTPRAILRGGPGVYDVGLYGVGHPVTAWLVR